MGKSIAVIGTQYGDEGKGKIVDYLAEGADAVVRYQGGANAGHTLKAGELEVITHHIPSGVLRGKVGIMGRGMVINPVTLKEEIAKLRSFGIDITPENLKIDMGAHLVLPEGIETSKGQSGTGKGIAPTYEAKHGKSGLRFYDLLNIKKRLDILDKEARPNLEIYREFLNKHEDLLDFTMENVPHYLWNIKQQGRNILFEGAQGVGLDVDAGQYPESTSSHTGVAGILYGAGVSHKDIDLVVGIAKAYVTRVDKNEEGPLVGRMEPELEAMIREAGGEFGATTGRPRRCGWFDLPLVRQAIRENGIDRIVLTKMDVLSGIDPLKLMEVINYEGDSPNYHFVPDAAILRRATPGKMVELNGWQDNIRNCRTCEELPRNATYFVKTLENMLNTPIDISVGPDREETIISDNYWKMI
jgi:adenylosuccinate synthase